MLIVVSPVQSSIRAGKQNKPLFDFFWCTLSILCLCIFSLSGGNKQTHDYKQSGIISTTSFGFSCRFSVARHWGGRG